MIYEQCQNQKLSFRRNSYFDDRCVGHQFEGIAHDGERGTLNALLHSLCGGDNKLIDISNTAISNIAVDEIGKTMTEQSITSLALSDEDIASLFPMASYIGERSVQATISPLTALLIPYITLVGKGKLYIKICFDGNHDNPNEPHIYTDGVYTYSYSEIGEESSIRITKNETRSDAAYIANPWILTLNKNNNNTYDIYHMINVKDARVIEITKPEQ